MEESIQRITYGEPVKIKLERGQRGSYGWEISIRGTNESLIIEQIKGIDAKLRIDFVDNNQH